MRLAISIDRGSALLFGASLLLCLLGGETLFRWRSFGTNAWSYSQMKSVRHIGESGLLQASPFQDILWELRPNQNTIYKLMPFTTNSKGLRDEEYSLSKAPNTFRVAVIGDSFTMGEGIAIEDAYHSVLERRFNTQSNGLQYEFINFGVAGYSLPQYVATIRHRVLEYKPDVILIGFCAANDSKRPNLEAFKHPYRLKTPSNGFFVSFLFEYFGNAYKSVYNSIRDRKAGQNADAEFVRSEFQQLASLSAVDTIPIVVAYIDNKSASLDYSMVENAARENGFEFLDATKNFPPVIKNEYAIFLTDGHPNGAANKIMADNLYPQLNALKVFHPNTALN